MALSNMELEALADWLRGDFELDSMDTAKKWVGRLLDEVKQLRAENAELRIAALAAAPIEPDPEPL